MKLTSFERLVTNSPLRGFIQRHIEAPALKKMASRPAYPICLELGTGTGRGTELILSLFGAQRVVATDVDPLQLERARKRLQKYGDSVTLRLADAMGLDEPDASYDAVFAFEVIHHTEDWRKALREIRRVLKPGGEYFFDELLGGFLKSLPMRLVSAHPEGGMFGYREFLDYLKEIGLAPQGFRRLDGIWLIGAARKES